MGLREEWHLQAPKLIYELSREHPLAKCSLEPAYMCGLENDKLTFLAVVHFEKKWTEP